MANINWANSADLRALIAKALANGADDWTVSAEDRTRAFLAEKERLQGEVPFILFRFLFNAVDQLFL